MLRHVAGEGEMVGFHGEIQIIARDAVMASLLSVKHRARFIWSCSRLTTLMITTQLILIEVILDIASGSARVGICI